MLMVSQNWRWYTFRLLDFCDMRIIGIAIIGLLLISTATFGQTPIQALEDPDTSTSNLVIIDKALIVEKTLDLEQEEILILVGNVQLHQDSLFMQCDSARKQNNDLLAIGNVVLQQWDSLNVYANELKYFGDTRDAYLKDSVVLQSKTQKLFTDSLAYNTATRIANYETGGTLTNDTIFLYSTRGIFNVSIDEAYFKDSVYIQSEDFELFADTLKYNTAEQKAYFLGPTRIQLTDGGQVYCEAGYYDILNKKALFTQNAQYVNGEQIAEGDSIFYFDSLNQVIMQGQASLTEPGKKASADTIVYYEVEEKLNLTGNAYFEDSIRTMQSESLIYDTQSDKLTSNARSTIENQNQFLEADSIDFNNQLGLGFAAGNVIWRDTSSHYTIICDTARYIDSSSYLKAFGRRPLLINEVDGDSMLLSADTLVSFENVEQSDTVRAFHAFNDVKVLKSDLQAVCDSLVYSSQDSIFHLYNDPIVWSDTSQFVADSITILMANDQIDKIFLRPNAFIMTSTDHILYSQMKGKEITAFFVEGDIDRMLIKGNAAAIYYTQDDDGAYIGANKTECSSMLLRFDGNAVREIAFYDQPEAVFHPIQKADTEALKLEGFLWRGDRQPHNISDITMHQLQ